MKRELLLDSIYTVEPKSSHNDWRNHWNYKWRGRNLSRNISRIRWRHEYGEIFTVIDAEGKVWQMCEEELKKFIHDEPNRY